MKRPLLLLPILALAAAPCLAQDPATNGPAATMLKEVLFPDARAPVWKFQPFGWPGETNVSTDVSPVEPPSPPFDLIGTWCHTNADFLIRMRIAGDGIQPIAELWWSTDKRNSNQGHLYIDWTPGKTEIAAGIEPHPDSASGLVLDFWSWETKLGDKLGPGMHNADFGESPVFASVCGKPVHPFAVSCSSSNGTLQASTWSDPSVVATKPVFQIDADRIRSENGKAAPGAMLEKELRSIPTPTAVLENAPMGEIIDLIGHVLRSERIRAGEPSRSSVEGGTEWFLPFFEGPSRGPDPGRLVACSGCGNLKERFASDPRISTFVPEADALALLEQVATAGNCKMSVVDGGVRFFSPACPARANAPAAPSPAEEKHAESAENAEGKPHAETAEGAE